MTENTAHQSPQPTDPLGTGYAGRTGITTNPAGTPEDSTAPTGSTTAGGSPGHGTAAPAGEGTATGAGATIRKFHRSRSNRMIAGVCGGGAELLGIDATLVRLLLIAATLLGFGAGIVLYLACWIIVPEE